MGDLDLIRAVATPHQAIGCERIPKLLDHGQKIGIGSFFGSQCVECRSFDEHFVESRQAAELVQVLLIDLTSHPNPGKVIDDDLRSRIFGCHRFNRWDNFWIR